MTNTGSVTINFSEERIDEAMLAQLKAQSKDQKNEQLTEDSDSDEVESIHGRPEGENVEESLKLYLKPDEMSDSSKLNFSYEVRSFTSTQLQLQLAFENKLYISISPSPD